MRRTIACLVPEGPNDDAGMVLVALNHAFTARDKRRFPIGVFCQCIHGPHAVGFDVRFIHH